MARRSKPCSVDSSALTINDSFMTAYLLTLES